MQPDEDTYTALAQLARTRHDVLPSFNGRPRTLAGHADIANESLSAYMRRRSDAKLMLEEHDVSRPSEAKAGFSSSSWVSRDEEGFDPAAHRPNRRGGPVLRQADFRKTYGAQIIALSDRTVRFSVLRTWTRHSQRASGLLAIVPQPVGTKAERKSDQ